MKRLTTIVSLLLVAVMLFALAACNNTKKPQTNSPSAQQSSAVKPTDNPTNPTDNPTDDTTPAVEDKAVKKVIQIVGGGSVDTTPLTVAPDYTLIDKVEVDDEDQDWDVYKNVLGDYYAAVLAAKAQEDTSARYALMAIAEAKMLEAGVLVPTTTNGGNYAVTKVAPKTVSSSLFGTDSDRLYKLIVATELIKAADRDALNAMYKELKGTGTYSEKAKEYLTSKGYTLKDTYNMAYGSEPQTWDILATYRQADSEKIVNTYDALVEYDNEGRILGALATSYEVSEDGLEYTFHLREGVKWVTSAGEVYADVTANDFVAGLQHLIDAEGGLESLVFGVIKNAYEYYKGEVEFSEVGVTAVDNLTLKYTLAEPVAYFVSMLTYNLFCPMNQAYFESQGDDYGTTPDNILYCGPYRITNHTEKNKIVFSQNENYYAKDDMTIKTLTWFYNDGKDVTKAYNDMKAGTIDGCGLNTTTVEMAKSDGLYDDYSYVTGTDATTYCCFVNVNRQTYDTEGYEGMASLKTDAQKTATKAALADPNFRMALLMAYNRKNDNAIQVGEELALFSVRNTYTPGTFVALERQVTIPINGKATTFEKGTYYGAIVQAQINADGYNIKVWDPEADNGNGSSDGFDGWYNPTEAAKYLDKAIAELAKKGIEVTAENPIVIDYPFFDNDIRRARANALKQSVEEALGGKVVLNLYGTTDVYAIYYTGYYCDYGYQCNYDIYDLSGWGPDYGDPATYLNTMLPLFTGDMTHCLGMY